MSLARAHVGQMVTWDAAVAAEQDTRGAGVAGAGEQPCLSKSPSQSKWEAYEFAGHLADGL
jgi:hypothetical protein